MVKNAYSLALIVLLSSLLSSVPVKAQDEDLFPATSEKQNDDSDDLQIIMGIGELLGGAILSIRGALTLSTVESAGFSQLVGAKKQAEAALKQVQRERNSDARLNQILDLEYALRLLPSSSCPEYLAAAGQLTALIAAGPKKPNEKHLAHWEELLQAARTELEEKNQILTQWKGQSIAMIAVGSFLLIDMGTRCYIGATYNRHPGPLPTANLIHGYLLRPALRFVGVYERYAERFSPRNEVLPENQ